MNRMKDVAKMLGVEIGEVFRININYKKYKFNDSCLLRFDDSDKCWIDGSVSLIGLLDGTFEIIKLPKSILDDVEKEYLSNVIKPFRKKIRYICKRQLHEHDYIDIRYKDSYGEMSMIFPDFKIGAMYKGMKLNKKYSLDDLGL